MKVPKSIREKMKRALKHYQNAHALMDEVYSYLEKRGINLEALSDGGGFGLEEISYGVDSINEICERIENGEFEDR